MAYPGVLQLMTNVSILVYLPEQQMQPLPQKAGSELVKWRQVHCQTPIGRLSIEQEDLPETMDVV